MDEHKQMLTTLLLAIWRGIPAAYKDRYRRTIWEQFENEILSAAYTSNLGRFVNNLCGRLGATVGTTKEERENCQAVLNGGLDKPLLTLLRQETTLLVLMVRVEMQMRREFYEALREEEFSS